MKILLTPTPDGPFVSVRYEQGVLTVNGKPQEMIDDMLIDYGEQLKCVTFSDDPAVSIKVIPSSWVDPTPPPKPDPEAEAQAALEAWRETEFVKSWQIIVELGGQAWGAIQAYAARPEADHVTRTLITYPPAEIPRKSDFVSRLAALLRMDDPAVDALFRRAKDRTA